MQAAALAKSTSAQAAQARAAQATQRAQGLEASGDAAEAGKFRHAASKWDTLAATAAKEASQHAQDSLQLQASIKQASREVCTPSVVPFGSS